MSAKLTIVVSGMVAGHPHQGGATWAVLQYVLGFRQLGHDVYLIEPVQREALQPSDAPLSRSVNARYFEQVGRAFHLENRSALLLAGTEDTVGLPYADVRRIAQRADLLMNISGMLVDEALLDCVPIRAYLDLDPAFVQLWQATQGIDMRFDAHTHFVTIGTAIGQPGCTVPTCDRKWITTLQPIVLSEWPVVRDTTRNALTTVGNWRGYGSIEHEGVHYGQKAHSLREFFPLPTRTRERFSLALSIHPEESQDLEALERYGWHLLDPVTVAGSPELYREFIQGSKAEFGIAKSGYVHSRCGWFSDRSICYLASGRPVLAQETGFSDLLPIGEGLFAFTTTEDVLEAIESLNLSYERHAATARCLAEEYFDSKKVLDRILDQLGTA